MNNGKQPFNPVFKQPPPKQSIKHEPARHDPEPSFKEQLQKLQRDVEAVKQCVHAEKQAVEVNKVVKAAKELIVFIRGSDLHPAFDTNHRFWEEVVKLENALGLRANR